MSIRPSTPEIITVNSDALQAQIRDLLPSQNGFGSELQASNVITPIIDLTAAAEGTGLRSDLQKSWDYATGSAKVENTTPVVLINQPGFYQINAIYTADTAGLSASTPVVANLSITDGATPKTVWELYRSNANTDNESTVLQDFVVFLRNGDSLTGYTFGAGKILAVQYRQIASETGTLVNPLGFSPL
jgi:hypothetical protein